MAITSSPSGQTFNSLSGKFTAPTPSAHLVLRTRMENMLFLLGSAMTLMGIHIALRFCKLELTSPFPQVEQLPTMLNMNGIQTTHMISTLPSLLAIYIPFSSPHPPRKQNENLP